VLEAEKELASLKSDVADLNRGYIPISVEDREALYERLAEKADGELVWMLLCTQRIIEVQAMGTVRNVARASDSAADFRPRAFRASGAR
jgi:hypothetical protein